MSPQTGTYRGDHGDITRLHAVESELILSENGTFRYFLINANTAYFTAKGRWSATDQNMAWTRVARSYLYHGGFKIWDTLAAPDTSYLRNLTDSGFERLEVTFDTLDVSVIRWVTYHRISPVKALTEGSYEYTETYRDGYDTTLTDTGRTRLEITRNGPYVQRLFQNGIPSMTDVDSAWTQAGSFLITTRNHHCEFEPGFTACSDAPFDYEYVAQLSEVGDTTFQLWIAPDFTYQPSPYWATLHKAP
jgi:hypothetical protein